MAHIRAWSDAAPLGTVAANQLDNEIRNLRVDIRERFEDLIGVGNFINDPIFSPPTGLKINGHFSEGKRLDITGPATIAESQTMYQVVGGGAGNTKYAIPIKLPVGYVLTGVKGFGVIGGVAGMTVALSVRKIAVATGVETVVSAVPGTAVLAAFALDTGVLAETILDNFLYLATFDLTWTGAGNVAQLFGIICTYAKTSILGQ